MSGGISAQGKTTAPQPANTHAGRPSRRFLLPILLFIAVSLGCKAAQGDWLVSPTTAAPAPPTATTESAQLATPSVAVPPIETPGLPSESSTPQIPSITIAPPLNTSTAPLPASPSAPPLPAVTPTVLQAVIDPQVTQRQLSVFEEIWGAIRDRYLYPDFNGLDWNAAGQEYRQRIQNGLSDEDFYRTMHEMIDSLGDEHSTFFSPAEAAENDAVFQGEATYVGIGVLTAPVAERQCLTVLIVFPGSPAEAAGIQVHDCVLLADGQAVMTDEGMRTNLLRGPEGSLVQVTVQTPGQEPRVLDITRRAVNQQMPVPRRTLTTASGKRIGYIYIPTFNEAHIDEMVGQAISEIGNAGGLDGLIIDNRFNGGGASDVMLNTISYFVDGQIGSFIENRSEIPLTVRGQDLLGSQGVPIVVLVGPGTASFGEVFSGALQDLGRAHIIGAQTEGNVEVLSIFNFSDGSRAWIATSTFRPLRDPSRDWEQTGIIPDQSIAAPWDQVTFETDPAILAAQSYLDALPTP